MKRNYYEPEMNISTFSPEDVVTTSLAGVEGVTGYNSVVSNGGRTLMVDWTYMDEYKMNE